MNNKLTLPLRAIEQLQNDINKLNTLKNKPFKPSESDNTFIEVSEKEQGVLNAKYGVKSDEKVYNVKSFGLDINLLREFIEDNNSIVTSAQKLADFAVGNCKSMEELIEHSKTSEKPEVVFMTNANIEKLRELLRDFTDVESFERISETSHEPKYELNMTGIRQHLLKELLDDSEEVETETEVHSVLVSQDMGKQMSSVLDMYIRNVLGDTFDSIMKTKAEIAISKDTIKALDKLQEKPKTPEVGFYVANVGDLDNTVVYFNGFNYELPFDETVKEGFKVVIIDSINLEPKRSTKPNHIPFVFS